MRKLIPLGALVLALVACGGTESKTDPASPAPAETKPKSNTVELSGGEYSYLVPETVPGGWTTLSFENTGDEPHEFALAKLEDGLTIEDVEAYLADPAAQQQPPPDGVEIRTGIPTLDPGEQAALSQELEPGRYVLICFLPDPEGTPHFARGMLRDFVVEGDAGAAAPTADVTLSLGPDLTAPDVEGGEQTFELRNDGDEPASLFLTAFEPGKTEEDLTRWEENGLQGPAPATFLGGAIDVPPNSTAYYTIMLDEGREYTLLDDVNDRQLTFTPN
jgi:hypothetical protein